MSLSSLPCIHAARIVTSLTTFSACCLLVIFSGTASLVQAQTIQPITWNVIGLDSNKPADTQLAPGVYPPDRFPVGVEVCNTTANPISGYKTVFVWHENPGTNYMYLWDSGVNLNDADNTNDTQASTDLAVPTLAAGACADMYHWVQIKQVSGAYNYTRDFHIELQDAGGNPIAETPRSGSTLGTDEAREIYVERLISQNRNTVAGYEYDGQSIPADGNGVIIVQPGQSFDLALLGQTATQGYEQIQLFMTLPPDLFEVSEVTSTYSASAGTDPNATKQLYADGCGWINNPADSGYHLSQYTCTGVGKYGGKVRKNYAAKVRNVTVSAGGSIDVVVQALIYDFSGSSYHYNSDYSSSILTIRIVDGENPPDGITPPALPTVDTSIEKTASFNGGSNSGTFTLTVTREADDCTTPGNCAKNFTLTDLLPPAFRLKGNQNSCSNSTTVVTTNAGSLQFADDESATLGTACNENKRFVQWNGTLPAGVNTVVAKLDFEKNPSFNFNGPITDSDVTNCGYLASDQDNTNNEGCVQVSVDAPEQFDVGIQKSVTQVTEDAQGNFIVTFKLEVSTLVGTTNDPITVSDALPAGYTYQALADVTGGLTFVSYNADLITFTYAAGSASGTATFTAIANVPSTSDTADQLATKYLNYVQLLDLTSGFPLNDLDLGNNEATAGWVPPLLQITKSPATTTLDPGGPTDGTYPTVSFNLTVKKFAGLVAGNTLRITEAPPAGLEFTGITEAGGGSTWTCTSNGAAITFPVSSQVVCDRTVGANETPLPFTYPVLTFAGRLNPVPTATTEFINSAFVEGYDGSTLIPNTFDEDNARVTYSNQVLTKVKIAGTLFLDQDADGGYDGIKNGTNAATDGGGNLYACLDTSPATFSTVIGSNGQFEFTGLDQGTTYNVMIFKSDQAPSGSSCPTTSTLNDVWYSTGESVDGSTTDSTVISKQTLSDGKLAVPVGDSNITTLTFGLTRAAIFDPPFGLKVGQILPGQAVIRWTMVWINDSPIPVNGAVISDAISEGTTYVADSLTCVAAGDSQCVSDEYDVATNQINVVANFAGETGNPTDGESAANEVIIAFDVTFDADNPLPKYENLGQLRWTPPGGTEKETTTDDPDRPGQEDPAEVVPSPDARAEPIPTLPAGLLLAMVFFLGLVGLQILLARKS